MSNDELIQDIRLQDRVNDVFDCAMGGDSKSIELAIEAIGNDDRVTELFIQLMSLARVDDSEDKYSKHYNPAVERVRCHVRRKAFDKLATALDKYIAGVLGDD